MFPTSRWPLVSALACFSARFSLMDLPAFLARCCRGDLSAMAVLPALGSLDDSVSRHYAVPTPPGRRTGRTAYPQCMGKVVVVVIIVAVAFWLLTKFRDNGRGGR